MTSHGKVSIIIYTSFLHVCHPYWFHEKISIPLQEVQNFYRLIAVSEEKVYDDTDMTVLQAVTCLMGFKSKYNFSNQYYNDIVKFVIDLIPAKYNMLKDLYRSKKIVSGLRLNYEKIDACEKIACYFRRSKRRTSNICITVGPDM
jgi:hypothetical protein